MRGHGWVMEVYVAPFAGAWIEISFFEAINVASPVAPFAGAWIEMQNCYALLPLLCRSLRGSVD